MLFWNKHVVEYDFLSNVEHDSQSIDDHWQFLCAPLHLLLSVFACPFCFINSLLKLTILVRCRWVHLETEFL